MTITVYTKPACVQCNATYKALDKQGLSYEIVDITEVPEARGLRDGPRLPAGPRGGRRRRALVGLPPGPHQGPGRGVRFGHCGCQRLAAPRRGSRPMDREDGDLENGHRGREPVRVVYSPASRRTPTASCRNSVCPPFGSHCTAGSRSGIPTC